MTKIGQVVFEKIAGQTDRVNYSLTDALALYYYIDDCQYRTICLVKLKRRPSSGTHAVCYP